MTTPKPTLALIGPNGDERRHFAQTLIRHTELDLQLYDSLDEFRGRCRGVLFSGIVLDLNALVHLDQSGKQLVSELEATFPVLWLRTAPNPERVAGVVNGQRLSGEALLDLFLRQLCRRFRPRGVRLEQRRAVVLSVLVDPGWGAEPFRASVTNVSSSGFFVVCPHDLGGDRLQLVVQEFSDRTPISCEVRWSLPWATSTRALPGFGVSIVKMSAAQREQLEDILARSSDAG